MRSTTYGCDWFMEVICLTSSYERRVLLYVNFNFNIRQC
ncbi:unnamed protein product [Brassica oleracea var. botrytis]|uniref:(rape) hypothetical protein n=1 Tax=Brassica napus TaxID=3708 RepID=A0A816UE11_BRANA|nr:unnamed protein product [Brassica napus]